MPKNYLRFEIFLVHMEGFKETVQKAWNKPVSSLQPLRCLHIRMTRTAKAIKKWRRTKLQLAIVKEIILCLETTQEDRLLSEEEHELLTR